MAGHAAASGMYNDLVLPDLKFYHHIVVNSFKEQDVSWLNGLFSIGVLGGCIKTHFVRPSLWVLPYRHLRVWGLPFSSLISLWMAWLSPESVRSAVPNSSCFVHFKMGIPLMYWCCTRAQGYVSMNFEFTDRTRTKSLRGAIAAWSFLHAYLYGLRTWIHGDTPTEMTWREFFHAYAQLTHSSRIFYG